MRCPICTQEHSGTVIRDVSRWDVARGIKWRYVGGRYCSEYCARFYENVYHTLNYFANHRKLIRRDAR